MKKQDVLWRLFVDCNVGVKREDLEKQFLSIFSHNGYEGLAKYIIMNIWVYQIDQDPKDTEYLRNMMIYLWENGQWPEDTE